jgi:hypothetical protein
MKTKYFMWNANLLMGDENKFKACVVRWFFICYFVLFVVFNDA